MSAVTSTAVDTQPSLAEARAWISMVFSTYRATVEPDPGSELPSDSTEVDAYCVRAMEWAREQWPEIHGRMAQRLLEEQYLADYEAWLGERR